MFELNLLMIQFQYPQHRLLRDDVREVDHIHKTLKHHSFLHVKSRHLRISGIKYDDHILKHQ